MSEAVAEGSIILKLDAHQLNRGLKKAAHDAKKTGQSISDSLKTTGSEFLKDPLGGDKGIIGMGGKAGVWGAIAAGVVMVGSKIAEASPIARAWRKEIELQTDRAKEWGEAFKSSIGDIKERLASLQDIAGTPKGLQAYQASIGELQAKYRAMSAETEKAREAADDMSSIWSGSLESIAHWLAPGTSREGQETILRAKLDAAKSGSEEAKKALEEVKKAYDRLMNPETNPAAIAAVRQFIQDQNDSIEVLKGTSAEYMQLIKLKRQYNLSQKQFDEAKAALDAAQYAKSQAEVAKATEEAAKWMKELEEDIGLVAKRSVEEAKLEEFIQKGIDEDQVQRIRKLIELKKIQNQQYNPLTALERGTAAELSFQNKNKFDNQKQVQVQALAADALRRSEGWLGRIFAEVQKANNRDTPEI